MKRFREQMELLFSGIKDSPSSSVLLELLCKEKKFKKRFENLVAAKIARMVANEVFADEMDSDYEDEQNDMEAEYFSHDWGNQ